MPFYTCTVNEIGSATDGTETFNPVVYINLTDTQGSFTNLWFYAADGGQNQTLTVGYGDEHQQEAGGGCFYGRGCSIYGSYPDVFNARVAALITTLIDLNGTWAIGSVPGPVISVSGNSLSVDMSASKRPTATGSILDRSDITVNFPDDKTYTAKLQLPNLIEWSNNSAWTKV